MSSLTCISTLTFFIQYFLVLNGQNSVIPVISLTKLRNNNNSYDLFEILKSTGCFYLIDHGISEQVISNAFSASKNFFSY